MRLWIVVIAAMALSGCDKLEKVQELWGEQPAPPNGRFQIVAMPNGYNQVGASAVLLDTRDGEVWRYYDTPPVGDSAGGTGIVYMGHLVTGGAPGSTVGGYKFAAPRPASNAAPGAAPN
jgi:hypothetical protein